MPTANERAIPMAVSQRQPSVRVLFVLFNMNSSGLPAINFTALDGTGERPITTVVPQGHWRFLASFR
jgi:hypothetical protein